MSLTQGECRIEKLFVGIGWSLVRGGANCEADASAFLLGAAGKVNSAADFIFYNQPSDAEGNFICFSEGQSKIEGGTTPNQALDGQSFSIDLTQVPSGVHRIVLCMTIHEAEQRGQYFGMAEWVHLRLVNQTTGCEIVRFQAAQGLSIETALQMGELYRRNDEWKFRAIGQGFAGGLPALAEGFGVMLKAETASEELPSSASVSAPPASVESPQGEEEPKAVVEETATTPTLSKKKRRSSADLMEAQGLEIRERLKPILPRLKSALQGAANESSTRLILDQIFQQVLGYSIEETKAEQKIFGRSADYVLSPGGVDTVVVEVKRLGSKLREQQIFQATSYAAHGGIKWAILTNVSSWQLYRVSTTDKIEPHLVFTIDLHKGLTDDAAYYFSLISRSGIMRKSLLDRLWLTRRALSVESLVGAILHDEVLLRIRNVIARDNGINLDLADIKAAVERDILQME